MPVKAKGTMLRWGWHRPSVIQHSTSF